MSTPESLPTVAEAVAEVGALTSGRSRPFPIDFAREVIAASKETITWAYAGLDWAELIPRKPGYGNPPL